MEAVGYHIEALHGAPGFDRPGRAAQLAAKLAKRLDALIPRGPIFFYEPDQGHFPVWLMGFFRTRGTDAECPVLAGRNIIALEASRRNLERAAGLRTELRSVIELPGSTEELLAPLAGRRYRLIAAFAGPSGKTGIPPYWEALSELLETGGVVLAAFSASRAEALDRKKPAVFTRLGDIKRGGFRALAYRLDGPKRP
jgi:hypothetical protein